jgi:hypothetical protein
VDSVGDGAGIIAVAERELGILGDVHDRDVLVGACYRGSPGLFNSFRILRVLEAALPASAEGTVLG